MSPRRKLDRWDTAYMGFLVGVLTSFIVTIIINLHGRALGIL